MQARAFCALATLIPALLAADALAAKAPRLKFREKLVSTYVCTTVDGERDCGARAKVTVLLTATLDVGTATFPVDSMFTLTLGQSTWTAPLSDDPGYESGDARAVVPLARNPESNAPVLTATLVRRGASLKVTVRGSAPVTTADFVESASEQVGKVDEPTRACIQLGEARADFGLRLRGRRTVKRRAVSSGEDSESVLLPQASISGSGALDGRDAPPDLAAKIVRVVGSGPPNRSPDVAVDGVAVSGSAISRITTQLDAEPEVDVTPSAVVAFPCGGQRATFASTVRFRQGSKHIVVVRAYDDQGRSKSTSATFVFDGPTALPKIVRMSRLVRKLKGIPDPWPVLGMIDDAGGLWMQSASGKVVDESPEVRLLPTATPTSFHDVVEVRDYTIDVHGEEDVVDRVRWMAVHEDGGVSVEGARVDGLPPVRTLAWNASYGYRSGLALAQDGRVFAWGDNTFGELGDGTTTARDTPAEVAGLADVARIAAAGSGERFALTSDGRLFTWGRDTQRLRGDPTGDFRVPGQIPTTSPVVDFATDSRGERLFLAHADGTVTGRATTSDFFHLGNGVARSTSTGSFFPATKVSSLADIALVRRDQRTFSDGTTFAVRGADGALFSWGANANSSCGLDTPDPVLLPAMVPSISLGVEDVRVWLDSVVARTGAGEVWGWGAYGVRKSRQDAAGGVGTASRTPVRVPGLSDVIQVESTFLHAFALTSDGRVHFWRTVDAAYDPQEIFFYK